MATDIYVYCPACDEESFRGDLEYDLEEFFGTAAANIGAGGGVDGFNLDYALRAGEDVEAWVARLRQFLAASEVAGPSTFFEVFPDGYKEGIAWRRVDLKGGDRWLTERDPK